MLNLAAWQLPLEARILFFKATFKNQPGYALRGPHGKRRWRKTVMGQRPGLFDLPDLEAVKLTGQEISGSQQPWALRQTVKEWAQRYRGKAFINQDTGQHLTIGKEGYRHLFGGNKTPSELQAVAALPALLEKAVLADVHEDRKNESQVLEMWRFYAPLMLNGQLQRMKMTVKVRKDGAHQFHELDALEIEHPAVNAREVVAVSSSTPYHGRPAGLMISIADLLRGAIRDSDHQPFKP
jgi:hypothetical protein